MENTAFIIISVIFISIAIIQMNDTKTIFNEEDFNCTKSGYQCSSYGESYYCIPLDEEYLPHLIENCTQNGKTCLESTGRCTAVFTCHQKGMFPHPYKCNEYFICSDVTDKPSPEKCPDGFDYNVRSNLCNKNSEYNECIPAAKICKTNGEINAVQGHESMYYICRIENEGTSTESLMPQFFTCPRDQIFNETECVTPEYGLNSDGKCLKLGYFYNPTDCMRYYQCAGSGRNPVNKTCSLGLFNPITNACDIDPC